MLASALSGLLPGKIPSSLGQTGCLTAKVSCIALFSVQLDLLPQIMLSWLHTPALLHSGFVTLGELISSQLLDHVSANLNLFFISKALYPLCSHLVSHLHWQETV